MKQRILAFLLSIVCFYSCNSEDDINSSGLHDSEQILFEISFTEGNKPATRAATTSDFKTSWEIGDEIGLFIVRGAGGLQPSGNWVDNVKLTRQSDGSWLPESPIYYPNLTDQLYFYAYYPYNSGMTDPTNHTFNVKADQRLESDYNKSDLLLAKKENVSKSYNAVQLQFSHALSLVQIEVTREINISPFTDDLTVTLTNAKSDALLDWSNTLTGIGTATNITMHKVEGLDYTYRALVPAQTLDAGSKVTFAQNTTEKNINMEYLGVQSTALTVNYAQKFKVTLGYGIDPDHAYAVGDVYPHIGPAVGIVYTISDGGKHGKVLGLDEGTGLNWNDWAGNNGASNMTNGIPNMKAMYDITSGGGWRPFQAYEWVHNHNNSAETYSDSYAKGVWYLPAKDELSALYLAYDIFGKTAFNNRLTTARGTELGNNWYWSSSEYDDNSAWLVMLGSGSTSYVNKTNVTYRTRCFLAF